MTPRLDDVPTTSPCHEFPPGVDSASMILRINVPQPLFLYAPFEDSLRDLSVSFTYRHYTVTLTVAGGNVEKATWTKPVDLCQWYRKATELTLTITETERSPHRIADLIRAPLHEDLLKLLEGVTLQIIRVIRNVGIAPELHESLPREESLQEDLQLWAPEVSEDGATWTRVFPPAPGRTLLTSMLLGGRKSGFAMNAELNSSFWGRIREVLEDDLEIPPEDEFLTNTTGHLRARNYRLAVVDAVIGLEIVLSRYLRAYLDISKGLPKKRINDFLRHDFGLTARLSGILDLTIHESWLKDINLDHVLKAVQWRNVIVHRTGRLPSEVPSGTVHEALNGVLKLARTLAELHVDVLAYLEKTRISQTVRDRWQEQIGWPRIWVKPWHQVVAEIACFGESLSREEMQRIAEDLSVELKNRDRRFDPITHLRVTFKRIFPEESLGEYFIGRILLKGESFLELQAKTSGPPNTQRSNSDTNEPETK